MKKNLLTFLLFFLALTTLAQERLYTDKEHGGVAGGIVGKIEDNLTVTPMGQLSYEIPIPALAGTAGMKPFLSVCYNSSTKDGLCGYGFDLQGLSIISRVPSDMFHDGVASAINFKNSNFALDGGRIILYKESNNAEREYKTENDTYSKIVSKGTSYNPDAFTIYTKSGLIYDYLPAQVALGSAKNDSTIFWLVTKVSDTKGNYFKVSYTGDASTNDFRPTKISYTGNDQQGLSPYASLRFSYIDNKYAPTTYVGGPSRVRRSKIISRITLCLEEQTVREFVFNYESENRSVKTKGPRSTIEAQYDQAGNRIFLNDPNLGISKDTYNAYGELTHHTDGYGSVSYKYDEGGRVVSKSGPYIYIENYYDGQCKGSLDASISYGNIYAFKNYDYDKYGRVVKETTFIGQNNYVTKTDYDSEGHVALITYPSGLVVLNNYDACGMLVSVKNALTGKTYWNLRSVNARGQVEFEEFGNGLKTTTTYNARRGTVSSIYTPGVQHWIYYFDVVGNLLSRRDVSKNLTETFNYDGLHRLTKVQKNGTTTQEMSYDAAGNIIKKSDIGEYLYEEGSNRLSSITNCVYTLKSWKSIVYCSQGKIAMVRSSDGTMVIDYGPDMNRIRCTIKGKRKYYPNGLFEETMEEGIVYNTNYIQAYGKTVAIVTDSPDEEKECHTMYVHHDHLGSIQAYSDESGKLYQELSYDAWGMRRNPATWERYDAVADAKAWQERGFGGHEHLDMFEMVNMDGRMYDPVVGRFLSPDPYVQSPDFTQGLNRYAYCLNNPLSLIDPSGYSWFSKNWKSLTAACVGIAVSVVTAGAGASIGTAIAAGAAGGAASALTCSLLNGSNIGQIAKSTFTGAFWGAVGGAANNLVGGIDDFYWRTSAHVVSEGAMEGLQGGNMLHGFMMGATASLGGNLIEKNMKSWGKVGKVAANSILSGTLEELGGGKFANGAITGAFTILFNDMMHDGFEETEGMRVSRMDKPLESVYPEFDLFFSGKLFGNDIYTSLKTYLHEQTGGLKQWLSLEHQYKPVLGIDVS